MNKQTINSNNKSMMHRQAPAAWLGGCLLSLGLVWAPPTLAAEVTCSAAPDIEAAGMNCFDPNTTAKSGEVNANFKHLLDQNKALLQRIAALETKLAAVSDSSTADHLLIEGANVQITNGAGTTDSANSKGNLIIGYNAAATREICNIGYTTQEVCEFKDGIWRANQRQGSHNVVIGDKHQYPQYGGFAAGYASVINGTWASVSGGNANMASGTYASVTGGTHNKASGTYASVSGGSTNKASGTFASVSGGSTNKASGNFGSSVSGGSNNTASGEHASVSGGLRNTASGKQASVSGGWENTARGQYASVSGGWENTASKLSASVSGGYNNTASGEHASVSGGKSNTAYGGFASVSGGFVNMASGNYASISAGHNNTAQGDASSVIGGLNQTAAFDYSIVP